MAKYPYNTTNWKKLRALKLSANPLCEHCFEIHRLEMATVVDHVDPISGGGAPFPPLDKLASLCAPCHNAKTARGTEAGAIRTTKPRKGCTPDGLPLDRSHPWRAEKSLRADDVRPTLSSLF
jgi:5-methylcytosine-specific restriction enzyme A